MEIISINSFLDYYIKIKERTTKLIEVVPEEIIDFSYKESKFTIADQIRHIAVTERYMFAETIQNRPCLYNSHVKELAYSLEEIKNYFDIKHQESMVIFRSLTNEDLLEKCITPGKIQITKWKWLRAMVEHEIHHRSQIYILLNLYGVTTPPIFGLTSEEIISNSSL